MSETPPKTKIAQIRAEQRRRQQKVSLLSQARYACFVLAFCIQMPARTYPENSTVIYAVACAVLMLAFVFWGWLNLVKQSAPPYELGESGFSGEDVCPDCGTKGTLSHQTDPKRLRHKNWMAFYVALICPIAPIALTVVGTAIDLRGVSAEVFLLFTILVLLTLPFVIALNRPFKARVETCSACGRHEFLGLDKKYTRPNLFIRIMERFWLPGLQKKWRLVILAVLLSGILPFATVYFFPSRDGLGILFLFLPVFAVGYFLFCAVCNQKFYEGYYEPEPEPEPKPEHASETKPAIQQ